MKKTRVSKHESLLGSIPKLVPVPGAQLPEKPKRKQRGRPRGSKTFAKGKTSRRAKTPSNVRVQAIAFKKKVKHAAEIEADKRLSSLRSDLVAELEQKIGDVSGESSDPRVGISFQAFYHFITIFLPFLIFWKAAEEEMNKPVKRRKRKSFKKKSSTTAAALKLSQAGNQVLSSTHAKSAPKRRRTRKKPALHVLEKTTPVIVAEPAESVDFPAAQ